MLYSIRSDTYLSVQCDCTGLALGADPLWPGRVALAARLDLTADVLQSCKLPSAGDETTLEPTDILKDKNFKKQLLTYQLHRSVCGGMRGMTCASPVGPGDSGSLRRKAGKNIRCNILSTSRLKQFHRSFRGKISMSFSHL